MLWFIDDIKARLDAVTQERIDAQAKLSRPMRSGERLVGVLPDELKRLSVLISDAYDRKEKYEKESSETACEPNEDGPDNYTRKYRAEVENKFLLTCFWESVRMTIPGAAGISLSMREDWQVATSSTEHPVAHVSH